MDKCEIDGKDESMDYWRVFVVNQTESLCPLVLIPVDCEVSGKKDKQFEYTNFIRDDVRSGSSFLQLSLRCLVHRRSNNYLSTGSHKACIAL